MNDKEQFELLCRLWNEPSTQPIRNNMEIYNLIRATRDLISNPDNWTKGTDARDANGDSIEAHLPGAVSFCVTGAMRRLGARLNEREAACEVLKLTPRYQATIHWGIENFNDGGNHPRVMVMLDQAIRMLEQEAQAPKVTTEAQSC